MSGRRINSRGVVLVVAAVSFCGRDSARADAPVVSLTMVADADPLELARVASRLDDQTVLRSLDPQAPVAERLAAVRAAVWLRAPECALGPLVELLAGRDSELAPAAAASLVRVANTLDAGALARREVLVGDLAPVRARLAAIAQDGTRRADLRALAGEAAAALGAAGVP